MYTFIYTLSKCGYIYFFKDENNTFKFVLLILFCLKYDLKFIKVKIKRMLWKKIFNITF